MDEAAINEAVNLLAQARQLQQPLAGLPQSCRPTTIAEGHAVQDALVERLGEPVLGWKVAGLVPAEVMRGAVLASRLYESPARMKASDMPLLGIEAEIAFRFNCALPARSQEYSADEVAEAVTALPAIEVVDTRFSSYKETPVLHRLGDCMSNGALVCGTPQEGWHTFDLPHLPVKLWSDGDLLHESVGGHSNGDPILPAIALANELRNGPGITAGQIVTTGTYSGLRFVTAGRTIIAEFEGFGPVEIHFEA